MIVVPIRRRLPLLISVLIGGALAAFGWIAYAQLERALRAVAEDRLTSASDRLATMLSESADRLARDAHSIAADPALVAHLERESASTRDAAQSVLARQRITTASAITRTLWTRDCRLVLRTGLARVPADACTERERASAPGVASASAAGPFLVQGDTVSYQVTAPVRRGATDTIGFVIETRTLSQAQGVQTIGGLIGRDAAFLVGNSSGPIWTNLASVVPGPPFDVARGRLGEYTGPDGVRQLGIALDVPRTPWVVWVQMPLHVAIAPAQRLLRMLVGAGLLCAALGAIGAWLVSRHLAHPLAELTQAAEQLAQGHYERRVSITRQDELGALAVSFNSMAAQIESTSRQLTAKARELELQYAEAQDLATELELSNHELLEALEAAHQARRDTAAAEALFEKVLASAPVGIAVFDEELRYVRLNDAVAAMNGVPIEQHLGRRPSEVLPALGAIIEPPLRQLLASGRAVLNQRIAGRLSSGAKQAWSMSLFPISDTSREIVGVGCILLDSTAREELEGQLLQAQKMEAIGRLAGGVAHDFNNLLTVITSYSSLALDALPDANTELGHDLEEIRRASQRAAELTRQLLAFSRKQLLQPQVVSLNTVVSETERMLRRLIGEDVELILRLDRDLGDVAADPGQLEQVVINLALNARDAMPDGGRLTIETANMTFSTEFEIGALGADAGEYVMLSVSDTGTGMDEETQTHLFEPFFTTKPQGQGTGLGLSTVYGIVKQSGGDIHVQSAAGGGSTFRLYFPRHRATGHHATHPAAMAAHASGFETVLLLEDDDAVRNLAARILRKAGYQVLEARTPSEALAWGAASERDIDLLLTDVVMPELNGRAVAERLASQRPGLRALYMSGYTDDEIVRRGIIASETHFLQKPFTPEQLTRRVRDVLDMNHAMPRAG